MKRMLKGLVFSSLILFGMGAFASCCDTDCCDTDCCDTDCCTDDCCTTCCYGGPCSFLPRPQGWAADRELVGWQQFINKFEMEELYGAFYITPGYTRSFKPGRIAGYLFGEDYKGGKLTISGSRKGEPTYTARGANDWLADYFGLSPNFESTVKFCPRISNFFVDLGMYLGLDEVVEGSFLKIHAPIVHTRWKLGMKETAVTAGTLGFDAGYMDATAVPLTDLPATFADAIKGVTWGDMQDALKYTKIDNSCCERTKTRLADIEVALGWNFLQDEDYHMGLMLRAAFPTGNKKCCKYIFEPIVGNGGHFELGGGLTASARLWTSDDDESSFWMYLDANVMHLFKKKLWRVFELKDSPNSRYMLVQEMKTGGNLSTGDAFGDATASTYQYNEKLMPLANLTACCVDTSVAVMGELALKFTYNTGNWSFDLGYNLWGRSGEKVCKGCSIEDKKYALKGDAFVIGFGASDATTVAIRDVAVPLSATQSGATIHAGTNTPVTGPFETPAHIRNPNIDPTVTNAWVTGSITDATDALQAQVGNYALADNQKTSTTPKFLTSDMLNTCKTPSALSHKVFAHLSYAWADDMDEDDWTPFLGIGGSGEFAGKSGGAYATISQWAVWLKGGVAFN